jgi:hypothetical protein
MPPSQAGENRHFPIVRTHLKIGTNEAEKVKKWLHYYHLPPSCRKEALALAQAQAQAQAQVVVRTAFLDMVFAIVLHKKRR